MSRICNLEKELCAVGPFTKLWSLFDFRTRICSFGSVSRKWGNASSILLLPRSRTSNIVQLMIEGGIFPSNSFPLRLRYSKLLSFENVEGIVPRRLFMPRCNTKSMLLKFPKHSGVEPLKLLLDKSRTRRFLSLQIEEEISPVSLLLDARIGCQVLLFENRTWDWTTQVVIAQIKEYQ
ncbi:hypothetical protein NC651_027909 [Populus alba x Populus x berolinensis]|nr:hypothetical protein NC651_027909 [Populus alba x Populus x berolinensis]